MAPNFQKYTGSLDSVAVFDPAIATRNNGDEIISQAARAQIRRVMPTAFQATIPTHERIGVRSYRFAHQAHHCIVAGSNIASDRMIFDRQWRLRLWDLPFVSGLIFLGVGWRTYKNRRDPISDFMRRRALSKDAVHSVRDEHTKTRLIERGFKNVVNTACVTMWDLDIEALANVPREKAHRVVTTLNVSKRNPGDVDLLQMLTEEYEEVNLWPQGISDLPYIAEISAKFPKIRVLGSTLAAYDELLTSDGPLDYVGNRLHGGVRALQNMRRTLILSVDNRASEIKRDTNLPVMALSDGIEALRARVRHSEPMEISLPMDEIDQWRSQFS